MSRFGLGTGPEAVPVLGAYVSANYFDVLGVTMVRGRGFTPEDERLDQPRAVVVISDRLWQTQFGGAADVVGRTVRLNGRPFTIVGVADAAFESDGLESQRLWVPLTAYPDGDDLRRVGQRGRQWLMGIGRLEPGVSLEQARAQLAGIAGACAASSPTTTAITALDVAPFGIVPVDSREIVQQFVGLLFALVGLVMLIACFTTAGLLLARGVTRAPKLGLRLALGAGRGRVVRLLVIESLAIALAGAVVARGLAWIGTTLLVNAIPTAPNRNAVVAWSLDWRVVVFAFGLAVVTGVICGVVPAWSATRPMLAATLSRERGGSAPRLRARAVFVVAQAPADRDGAPTVAIVNETLARQCWPGQDAVGKRILVGQSRWPVDVIGVVKDAKYRTMGEAPNPFFYLPSAQRHERSQWIVIRPTAGSAIAAVRAVIRDLDPHLPVTRAGALEELTAFTLFPQRLVMWLASAGWPSPASCSV